MNPTVELITKMADDALIIGHRHSEWTGLGPILEEDIAMASMAQDKIGHALALYTLLQEHFAGPDPDTMAFSRKPADFRCCHLVEHPNGDYDFTLMRHFLFDHAEWLRYQMLRQSSFAPMAHFANRISGELKYHILHANTLLQRLARGSEESHARLQAALNDAFPLAMGIFEPGPYEQELAGTGVFAGEEILKNRWFLEVEHRLLSWGFQVPALSDAPAGWGGRKGYHTEFLQPLLDEMAAVIRSQPEASW
ncbi:MAG: 1,2-phenylacetyl-CoA epoxidase subunit PaaC [Chitinophagales bacterium]|nr:phenylacetate-CoA oxygenase subunit PaaC [Chitinophagales bacterium]MDW8393259.1 1,2-phenylacetyl-CoA epoxidase subunit PaaC [Chitinophagales bacterium]